MGMPFFLRKITLCFSVRHPFWGQYWFTLKCEVPGVMASFVVRIHIYLMQINYRLIYEHVWCYIYDYIYYIIIYIYICIYHIYTLCIWEGPSHRQSLVKASSSFSVSSPALNLNSWSQLTPPATPERHMGKNVVRIAVEMAVEPFLRIFWSWWTI